MSDLHSKKMGVLIINLGTPEAPTQPAVKKYLAEFLWDPYIVQIPRPIWWLLLHGVILQSRPKKSALLYQKIWLKNGSPQLVYSLELVRKLQTHLGANYTVELGMRYGKPSILEALQRFKALDISTLIVLPLYPQFSHTTSSSSFAQVKKQLLALNWQPKVTYIDHYATNENYLNALTSSIQTHWQQNCSGQKLLFSFHGIPKRNILKGDPYYDQCLLTATKVAEKLTLENDQWDLVFQSRFGRQEWLQPYCNQVLEQLPQQGYKNVDIICPGFAVDCLETLEEIAITYKALFLQSGGDTFNYIPALNDSDQHVESLAAILLSHSSTE